MERRQVARQIQKPVKHEPTPLGIGISAVAFVIVNGFIAALNYCLIFLVSNLETIWELGPATTFMTGGSSDLGRLFELTLYLSLIEVSGAFLVVINNEGGEDWISFVNLCFIPFTIVLMVVLVGGSITGVGLAIWAVVEWSYAALTAPR